ncbi:septation ring formation regulator EzrA [Amphibacillus cookii]|uniref:septation ring formation regulator EzrA n=1 Tax=Amphibacillus cookii TaxID=767787 RepID=UPI00195749D4|nr:septation ring formation regulator EzrA [Amphibacillus cookii]MBM7543027.1 septation ring formation regulator [Amphibacillus cookii]
MVTYIIGFILVIITLIIVGLILRKRVYDRVDQLEAWKMDIMNRNVTAELQRVKALRLSGETQEKFESWKETWDRILTRDLPDIEEYLFDAEAAADGFKIPNAKKNLAAVEKTLNEIEQTIKNMYSELDDLLDSEKQSRKEVEKVIPQIKSLRQTLLEGRHLFGAAEQRFEKEINEQQQLLDQFYVASDEGNYYEARQIIQAIQEQLADLAVRIEDFPVIYKKCKQELPDQINQLKNGIKEMKQEGYRIEHHNFLKELASFEQEIVKYLKRLEETDDQSVYDFVTSLEERIQEIYGLLEKEANAKQYIDKHLDNFKTLIADVVEVFQETDDEVKELQKTYYMEGSDLELYANLEKWIHQLERQHEQMMTEMTEEKQTFVSLRDQLESSYQDLQKLKESHEEFKEQVKTIRKDEVEAKEKIQLLQRQLYDTNRRLQKSNLPGIPSFIWNQLDEATEKCSLVMEHLNEQPLDMGKVNHTLNEASTSVNLLLEQTDLIIEQAYLVERVIQYANRYRSQYPVLTAKLLEAEQMFREYRYQEALEIASQALEDIEPGALARLETRIKVPS